MEFGDCPATRKGNGMICAAAQTRGCERFNPSVGYYRHFRQRLTHCSIQNGEVKMPPLLFYFLPMIVLAGLTEVMLTTYELEGGDADQHTPDSANLMNASIIRFPTATRG